MENKLTELKEKAIQYVNNKAELDVLDKRCKSLNTTIKSLMEILNIDEIPLDDGTVVKSSVITKESLDEEKLIIQLKKFAPQTSCIKTKEYIDTDVLENEMYHGDFSDEALKAMDSCRIVKETVRLDIKKKKKS